MCRLTPAGIGPLTLVLLLSPLLCAAQPQPVTLTFDEPLTAVVNARAWDQTQQQWDQEPGQQDFFDAVHRFLLLRFPGCAEPLYEQLRAGLKIQSAHLELTWEKQEDVRVAGGYQWRSSPAWAQEPPQWHAQVWLLRRPWVDDPQLGPTWNSYLNGLGYWRAGGGRDPSYDRSLAPLAEELLSRDHPVAEVDVTAALQEAQFGVSPGERLRGLAERGFLVCKAELGNREYGEYYLSTGPARVWVGNPRLVVTMAPADQKADPGPLPAPVSVSVLATRLRASGGDGAPTTVIPDNLPELAAAIVKARRTSMPEWMWQRVEEVRHLPPRWGIDHPYDWFTRMMDAFDSGDRDRYLAEVQRILATPPGWTPGHKEIEYLLPLIEYDSLLPDVVRYHLRQGFLARWQLPLDPSKVFGHGVIIGMGTLNHMCQHRPTTMMGAELTGDVELARMVEVSLDRLYRQMIWNDGFSQEMGDSYYRGITLTPLQQFSRLSADPVMRLKASLAVEKLLFEDMVTYHPGLHRRVARISRRMGPPLSRSLLLDQDVPEAALHTLSHRGVLIETDAPGTPPAVRGMPVYGFGDSAPARVAMAAPWGRDWECHNIEDKPLPFTSVFSTYIMGRLTEPLHAMSYLGHTYGLASDEAYSPSMAPLVAYWRRSAQEARRLDDLGVMVILGRANGQPDMVTPQFEQTPFGILQHNNKLLLANKPLERPFLLGEGSIYPSVKQDGLRSLSSQVSLFAYGPEDAREVWVNDQRVTTLPARAKAGDVITVREGVTYLGFIPLPGTNLGRKEEVVIRAEHPLLALESYMLQTDQPLPNNDATAATLADAHSGWAVEMGDATEYADFAAFRAHLRQAKVQARWDQAARVWHLAYTSGSDTLEMGFRTTFERQVITHQQLNPSLVFAYQRVNGAWPWPGLGVDLDTPFGQMGRGARLEKGGAVLEHGEGQVAFLRVEPVTGTYEGINPVIDPTPFELRTPEGAVVRSEGPLGLGRIVVRPRENRLWVDYQLPPPGGDLGEETLQASSPGFAGLIPIEVTALGRVLGRYFLPGVDARRARGQSARALLVSGLTAAPTVVLNGQPWAEPLARYMVGDSLCWRVPITRETPVPR